MSCNKKYKWLNLGRVMASALFIFLSVANTVFAAGININFSGTNGRDVTGAAGAVAVTENYNNLAGANGAASDLLDAAGLATTADISWASEASWFSNNPGTTQDAALLDGYLATGSEEYGTDIVISEIPYAAYDVYVYFGNNNMGATGNLRINNGGTQFFYNTSGLLPTFTGFDLCVGRTNSTSEDGNYVVFSNVQGATLIVQQANIGGGQDSGVMGIQIVEQAPAPRITLGQSVYELTDDLAIGFALGQGVAENNIALVPQGGNPSSDVERRLYVGGGTSPSGNPTNGTVTFTGAADLNFGWYDAYFLADSSGNTVLAGPETFEVSTSEPTVVTVGAGSYASHPPSHEGAGATFEAFQRDFYVVDDATARPIPTNDWWTDLLINQYAGAMWAYPLVVSADSQGANVFYPTAFNGGGTEMILNSPVEIHGEAVPTPDPTDRIVEDFESGTYPAGWSVSGTAFGSGPAGGTLPGQGTVTDWVGSFLVNSFLYGDSTTGMLTSPPFTIDRDYLHFKVGGGNHPWSMGASEVAAVNLVVGGNVVETATGVNSEQLRWELWDVSAYTSQTATLEIIDTATGSWGHILADHFFLSDDPSDPTGRFNTDFTPGDARALAWTDWTVTMRQAQNEASYIDVTFGHGLPAVWVEPENVAPILRIDSSATFFDSTGAAVSLPTTTDHVGVNHGGRRYGLFLPDNTQLEFGGGVLRLNLPNGENYFALVALTDPGDLATFLPYIYAVPRSAEYSWSYNPIAASVETYWDVTAEALKGTNTEIIQGWIPHHYRNTTNNLAMNGLEYLTPRGTLQCSVGSSFTIAYRFAGMAPHVPAPQTTGLPNDYIASRMERELTDYAAVTNYGADSYFGGKDLLRFARYMSMAHEMGHSTASTLEANLRNALVDWFTYSPGETEHYFAWFPNYRGLVGFNESFFTTQFTDHHFHYGYHVASSAALGRYDRDFLNDYGDILELIAKEYANWDRTDTRFPYLRTYDIWAGHSLAGGHSSPSGNNQESTGEAINSWAGLFFLGNLLGDADMAAAGAMGYTIETEATLEYWYDINGDTWSPNYTEDIVGILFDRGPSFSTFFSGDPAWIYGIQWLPPSPTVMGFLARDAAFADQVWQNLETDRIAAMGNFDIGGMGASLGNILIGYRSMADPDFAAAELDRLWSINSPVITEVFTGGISYYFTHAQRRLGAIQFDQHMSSPLGTVFHNADTGMTTYVAYNPTDTEQEIEVFGTGVSMGCFSVAPYTLGSATTLVPGCGAASVNAWRVY
jgi:endoglucanase Acf2